MPIHVILGAQWGDEGKGKVSQILSAGAACCARFQGEANAGRTFEAHGSEFVLRQVPRGVLQARTGLVGGGMAINPLALVKEIRALEQMIGEDIADRLLIASNAHVILPEYMEEDCASSTSQNVETTGNEIGQTYIRKCGRRGVRFEKFFSSKMHLEQLSLDPEWKDYRQEVARLEGRIVDCASYVRSILENGELLVGEGAQGMLLDIDQGEHPFVSGSNTGVSAVLSGLGAAPDDIERTFLVASCYMTKVGGGAISDPMPLTLEAALQARGAEIDGAAGKTRRCGWLNIPMLQRACLLAQPDFLIITRIDVLACIPTFMIVLADGHQETYSTTGWVAWCRSNGRCQMPETLKDFVSGIEYLLGVPVGAISFGRSLQHWLWLDEGARPMARAEEGA
jgi:adenylosuccinate synthase